MSLPNVFANQPLFLRLMRTRVLTPYFLMCVRSWSRERKRNTILVEHVLLLSNRHLSMILLLHMFPLNISIAGGGINHKGHLGHFFSRAGQLNSWPRESVSDSSLDFNIIRALQSCRRQCELSANLSEGWGQRQRQGQRKRHWEQSSDLILL